MNLTTTIRDKEVTKAISHLIQVIEDNEAEAREVKEMLGQFRNMARNYAGNDGPIYLALFIQQTLDENERLKKEREDKEAQAKEVENVLRQYRNVALDFTGEDGPIHVRLCIQRLLDENAKLTKERDELIRKYGLTGWVGRD